MITIAQLAELPMKNTDLPTSLGLFHEEGSAEYVDSYAPERGMTSQYEPSALVNDSKAFTLTQSAFLFVDKGKAETYYQEAVRVLHTGNQPESSGDIHSALGSGEFIESRGEEGSEVADEKLWELWFLRENAVLYILLQTPPDFTPPDFESFVSPLTSGGTIPSA
jgi:hypothetical protein